ncbi:hypothetical protein PV646_13695 [Streptomyces sp. ID05-26A]|nr:hypothetical protein [Streptomyces sp. ID05-26A]
MGVRESFQPHLRGPGRPHVGVDGPNAGVVEATARHPFWVTDRGQWIDLRGRVSRPRRCVFVIHRVVRVGMSLSDAQELLEPDPRKTPRAASTIFPHAWRER